MSNADGVGWTRRAGLTTYTSAVGADDVLAQYRDRLAEMGFDPRVFQADARTKRSHGVVDITLATEMLRTPCMGTTTPCCADSRGRRLVPLVEQVKRLTR